MQSKGCKHVQYHFRHRYWLNPWDQKWIGTPLTWMSTIVYIHKHWLISCTLWSSGLILTSTHFFFFCLWMSRSPWSDSQLWTESVLTNITSNEIFTPAAHTDEQQSLAVTYKEDYLLYCVDIYILLYFLNPVRGNSALHLTVNKHVEHTHRRCGCAHACFGVNSSIPGHG